MMRFRGLSADAIRALDPRPYPGFPEYVLLDVPGGEPSRFRRGATQDNLFIPEARVWQDFLADHYCPPELARLLVLHQCSWAKPYDMSATLQPVADICRRFAFAHRVVVSNVGLVPAELQMNPIFCSYDWVPLDGNEPAELTAAFHRLFAERLHRYLAAHRSHYAGILVLAERRAGSKLPLVVEEAKAFGLPLFAVPDVAGWRETGDRSYRDPGDRIRHPIVLRQLVETLERIAASWDELGVIGGDALR
jgi:hypothetical protein